MNSLSLQILLSGLLLSLALNANAANQAFQDFFFGICQNGGAQGNLIVRCNETAGGLGDLSGDSESSLNPTQTLNSNDAAIGIARRQAKQNRERLDAQNSDVNDMDETKVSVGPFSLLVNGRSVDFERDQSVEDDRERNFDGDGWGLDLGFDYRVSDTFVAGAILSYSETDATFARENDGTNFFAASNAGSMESDGWSLSLFGTASIGESGYLDFSGGYGSMDYELGRNSVFQESGRSGQTNVVTTADTEGTQLWAGISSGFTATFDAINVGPYVGLVWAKSEIDGYTESDLLNTGLNLRVNDTDLDSLIGQLGFNASYTVSTSWGVLIPQLRVEYDYEFEDDAPLATTSFLLDANAATYSIEGVERDQDFVDVGLSLVMVMPEGFSAFLNYSTLLSYDDLERDTITVGVRVEL